MKLSDPDKRSQDVTSELRSECNVTSYASVFFEEELQISKVLLEESKHRNLFLTKVGVVFTVVFGWLLALCLGVRFHQKVFGTAFGFWASKIVRFVFYCSLLILKTAVAFYSSTAKKRPWLFLTLDVVLLSVLVVMLTLEYDTQSFETMSLNENWVSIVLLNFFLSYGVFTLTTLYSSPVKIYNYWVGLFGMWMVNIFAILTIYFTMEPLLVQTYQYILAMLFFIVVDCYLALNAYFVVNYRVKKFYTNEYIFCYFCFWADWFSFFWKDVIQLSEVVQDKINRATIDRRRKKAKEVNAKKKNSWNSKNSAGDDNMSSKAAVNQKI
jgi:hypothetical protein